MPTDVAGGVAAALPRLRRYARALTGSQEAGDAVAARALEAMALGTAGAAEPGPALAPGLALFHAFHAVWVAAGHPSGEPDARLGTRARGRMARLAPRSREALLLHAVEGFSAQEIGAVLDVTADRAAGLVDAAIHEMEESVAGRVLIVEDEAVIALDLAAIVEAMGHRVTGVARTRAEAARLALAERPDLVLADVQLADGSSGIDAVADILHAAPETPAIFVTAFPERLLTGARPEPAFLIPKPFAEDEVRSAVSQAMFFAGAEALAA